MTVSIPKYFSNITDTWSPHLVARVNGQQIKIAKIDGAFVFHLHPESDELFYVLSGRLIMKLEEHEHNIMSAGDMWVVPKGLRHGPVADNAEIMLVEAANTINTGDAPVSARMREVNTRFHGD
ncbi:hypothetical protein V2A60_006959 [Cordyceps javanica]|uniref:Cupin 2 conserved barrel domain-containing protein n=1 Tax=Cordyceps javanica TaxID=43265 RepID=A0A545US14_9HYPO|nr:Cupin 2 conserved barrel domain-containing protein [Cordyceps javanica]TQW04486.1 Cupin 2 conserved barrel domain protein [Cordyceps javanica]